MNTVEFGTEIYEWFYSPVHGRVRVWKDDVFIIEYQDTLNEFLNPDYGDQETQVQELIMDWVEAGQKTGAENPCRI